MNRLLRLFLTAVFVVLIVMVFYLVTQWISHTTGYVVKSEDSNILGRCFYDKQLKLYVSPGCTECDKQINELNEAIRGIEIVDCIQNQRDCSVLSSLPAIEQENRIYYGLKSLDEIRSIIGC